MTNDTPVATIKEQPLTTPPFTADSTLVDDTVVLVDGTALVGGPTVTSEDIPRSIISDTPKAIIQRYS